MQRLLLAHSVLEPVAGTRGGPSWAEARHRVMPLLQRRRRADSPQRLAAVRLAPGVAVGFGLDLGPCFLRVSVAMLRRWGMDEPRLARQAIGNLRRRARLVPAGGVTATRFGLTPAAVLQVPDGWSASLILAPDLLPRWFGARPRLLLVPARNVLIGLPATVDPRLARWLGDTIAEDLPDALDVPLLAFDGGRLRCVALSETTVHEARTTW